MRDKIISEIMTLYNIIEYILEQTDPVNDTQFVEIEENDLDTQALSILNEMGLALKTNKNRYKINFTAILKKLLTIMTDVIDRNILYSSMKDDQEELEKICKDYSRKLAVSIHTFIDRTIINESIIEITLNFEDIFRNIEDLQAYKDEMVVTGYYAKLSDGRYTYNASSDLTDLIEKCNIQIEFINTLIENYTNKLFEIYEIIEKYPQSMKIIDENHAKVSIANIMIKKSHPYYQQFIELLDRNIKDMETILINKRLQINKSKEIISDIITTLKDILIIDERFIRTISDNMYANLVKLRDNHINMINKLNAIIERIYETKRAFI